MTLSVLRRPGWFSMVLGLGLAAIACGDDETEGPPPLGPSILEVAQQTGDLSTLVQAVAAAELAESLDGNVKLTVFAPTNAAFQALPAGALEALLADPDALTDVLRYHIVGGELPAAEVVSLDSVATVQGEDITITPDGDSVKINDANLVQTDIFARNGVVHLIDQVLMPPLDVVETAQADPQLSTLAALIEDAGLADTLKGDGPFTVFAPTDAAFDALPSDLLTTLQSDTELLAEVLSYHVVAGEVTATEIRDLTSARTLQGEDVTVSANGSALMINDATVTTPDIQAKNGIVHEVDAVLIPPTVTAPSIASIVRDDDDFSTLETALEAADLLDALDGRERFTVFAPTNAAFDALPAGTVQALLADIPKLTQLLRYHLLEGRVPAETVVTLPSATTVSEIAVRIRVDNGEVILNDTVRVTTTDVLANNGTIHVIDAVLIPPTVVDIAAANPDFSTLVSALQTAQLVDTLDGDGPFTVFAPTNAAFDALPEGALDALLADTPELTKVLTYHVVAGATRASEVAAVDTSTTVSGFRLRISADNGAVTLNGSALVTTTDIRAANGIIHVIDAVLLPVTIVDVASGDDDFGTLVTALSAADLVTTLDGPGPFTVFAPTNAAFDALPPGVLDDLLADIPALTDVLTYHVISADLRAADIVTRAMATMLNRGTVGITVVDDDVVLTDGRNRTVNVTTTDILTANGVIHVIDAVLLPPN